jgi:hypothetical protein
MTALPADVNLKSRPDLVSEKMMRATAIERLTSSLGTLLTITPKIKDATL